MGREEESWKGGERKKAEKKLTQEIVTYKKKIRLSSKDNLCSISSFSCRNIFQNFHGMKKEFLLQ